MGHTQDDVGIAKIEEFLDRIEDPDEAVFDAFQDTFNIVKESLKLNDEEGSEEFLKNKAKAEELSAKVCFEIQQNNNLLVGVLPQGGGYVLPGALKVNDGFKECTFKFVSKSLWQSKFKTKYHTGAMWTRTTCLRVKDLLLSQVGRGSPGRSREGSGTGLAR